MNLCMLTECFVYSQPAPEDMLTGTASDIGQNQFPSWHTSGMTYAQDFSTFFHQVGINFGCQPQILCSWAYGFMSHICGENREHSSQICIFFDPLCKTWTANVWRISCRRGPCPFPPCEIPATSRYLRYLWYTVIGLIMVLSGAGKKKSLSFSHQVFICIGYTSFFHRVW